MTQACGPERGRSVVARQDAPRYLSFENERVLKRVTPQVAIILHPADLSFPSRSEDLFGRPGPIVLEVGFGNGDFLCSLAATHRDWNIIGVETSPSSVIRAYRRISRRALKNVKVIARTGEFVVRNVAADESLECVFVNFPDPWPRRRHHDRRLLSQPFFEMLASRLRTGGQLVLTTDHEDYYRFAVAKAEATGLYSLEVGTAPSDVLDTRWARRWLEQGRAIHHARFRKAQEPTSTFERIRTTNMQHSLLRGSLNAVAAFDRYVVQRDGINVVVTEALRQIGDDAMVFPTIVEENELRQFLLIEAQPRDDEVLVGVKRFGHPLSTPGVNMAVEAVAELLERHGLEMVERVY